MKEAEARKKQTNNLSEAARQARNAYQRNYTKNNPGKRKEIVKRYWERKAAKMQEGG